MVSKTDGKLVLWPAYFDVSISKEDGRRLPKALAVQNPTLDQIEKACKSLGLNPVREDDKLYSSQWYGARGRILIDNKGPKAQVLKQIAEKMKPMQQAQASQAGQQ
ncbi:MAG: signal recognition particle subunit SRP19/SEC65 family protein [Candidatus Thermoplasmatota archaeon]|nr:signal recognition particle subunit SRP19/SEC65 family protein [Candidatus Thermoplasmatota archaeon]